MKKIIIDSCLNIRHHNSNKSVSEFIGSIHFIATSSYYGVFLLWCGFTYLIGQGLFIYFIKSNNNIDTQNLSTHSDFFLKYTKSLFSARVITFLTFFTFLSIFFLEVYIGSEIIRYYFAINSLASRAISFALIGFIVIAYVRLGGLKVVFRTDVWQTYLMTFSCLALFTFALLVPETEGEKVLSFFDHKATNLEVFLFMLWIAIINLTLPFTQLSSWQRLVATKTKSQVWKGFRKTLPNFLVIWVVSVVALIILNMKGYNPSSLSELFDVLRSSNINLSIIFFPIIFVGFSSALFSTADTALVAMQFSLSDKTTFYSKLKDMTKSNLRLAYISMTFVIVILLTVLYSFAEWDFGNWFLPLVFAIFGQLAIIAPQMVYSLAVSSGKLSQAAFSKKGTIINLIGLLLAWVVSIGSALFKVLSQTELVGVQEIGTVVSILVSTMFLLIAIKISKRG